MFKVAILDDSAEDQLLIADILGSAGHTTAVFGTAQQFLRTLRQDSFDAIIVDWNLPDMSGLEVVKKVRTELLLDVPIIMVTARDADHETVEGLKAGADDYITKPAQRDVLLARLDAVSRRKTGTSAFVGDNRIGQFEIDVSRRSIMRDGVALPLTDREFKLAYTLFRHVGHAVSRDYLHSSIWGRTETLESRTLDVHMSRVRAKLSLSPEFGWRLVTVYGYGYRLETVSD